MTLRKGITPVMATILLILITIFAASVSFTVFNGVVDSAGNQNDILSKNIKPLHLSCQISDGEPDEIFLTLKNKGEGKIGASGDLYVYRGSENPYMRIEDLNWSNKGFAEPGNQGIVRISASKSELNKNFQTGDRYHVKVHYGKGDPIDFGFCLPKKSGPKSEEIPEGDIVPPLVEDNYTDDEWKKSPQEVKLTCSDSNSECKEIHWELYDGNENLIESEEIESKNTKIRVGEDYDGGLELKYRGKDSEDNIGEWNSQIIRIDKTPPYIFLPGSDKWFDSDIVRSVDEGDSGSSDIDYCSFRVKNGDTDWTGEMDRECGEVEVSIGQEAINYCRQEGFEKCTVQVSIANNAGNVERSTASFNIDYSKPFTEITAPDSSEIQSSDFSVKVDDQDKGEFAECRYRINEGLWRPRNCPDGQFEVNVGEEGDCKDQETCRVDVRTEDKTGRRANDTSYYTINISSNGSYSSIIGPDSQREIYSNFTVTVDDESSDYQTCSYRVADNGSWSSWKSRKCLDGIFQVNVGLNGECSTEGTNACTVETRLTESGGQTFTDKRSFDVNLLEETLILEKGDKLEIPDTNSSLKWGTRKPYRANKIEGYERGIKIGNDLNISVYAYNGDNLTTTIWKHGLRSFSEDQSIIKLEPDASQGTEINYKIAEATSLVERNYALYKNDKKVTTLSDQGSLTWENSWSSPHNYTVIVE